jgi:hypothetical protein
VKVVEIVSGVRPRTWLIVVAVILLLGFLIWWFRTPTAKLEQNRTEATAESKAAEKNAQFQLSAQQKVFLDAMMAREPERKAHEANDARLVDLLERQMASANQQSRQADVARLPTVAEPELQARAVGLVGPMSGPRETYAAVIRLAVDRDQARDELGAAKESISAGEKERALLQQLADERKTALDGEKRHSDQLAGLMRSQQDAFGTTLAELRAKSEAEREANEKLVRRLKGSAFGRAVKTGIRVGAGIGIGIAIGKVMN